MGRYKSIIYGIRKEWNDPRFRENFELLARKGSKWLESHSPKVGDQRRNRTDLKSYNKHIISKDKGSWQYAIVKIVRLYLS